ncbi:putative ankyrin repeat protein [Megavirus lba]|uniref:Putative ankyrin repeat protein n=1 Tax=Megavirus lba TaxID=1235314 RepID=L7Y5G6_9VIRU|nr:putative ankyrin repeat protein [Megavirus lba]
MDIYYAFIPDTAKIDLSTGELKCELPEFCNRILKIQNLFRHNNWNTFYNFDVQIIELSFDISHPKFKITQLSKNPWLPTHIIIHNIYLLKDINSCMSLIEKGADTQSVMLFDWACMYGFIDLVKYLHFSGIRINNSERIPNGLKYSVYCNHIEIFKHILDNNNYYCYDITELFYPICSRERIDMFDLIIKYIEDNNFDTGKLGNAFGDNLIHLYIQGNYDFCIKFEDFMEKNNICSNINYLYYAVHGKNFDLVKHVINKYGHNQEYLNEAVDTAIYQSNTKIIKYLINLGAVVTNIHNYFFDGYLFFYHSESYESRILSVIKYVIKLGANIHNNNAMSKIIMNAAKTNNFAIVKYLIEQGINYEVNNNFVLRCAVQHNQIDFIKYVIDSGCNLDDCNESLLEICVKRECMELLDYFISINLYDTDYLALYKAIELGNIIFMEKLLSCHENIIFMEKLLSCHENIDIEKILEIAVKNNRWKIIQYLFCQNIIDYDYGTYNNITKTAFDNKKFETFEFLTNQYPDHECDSLIYTIAKNIILEPSNICQDFIDLNLTETLLITEFIIYKNNNEVLNSLISLNDSAEYNSSILNISINYPTVLKYLLDTKHFDMYINQNIIESAKNINNASSIRLLQIYEKV